MTPRIASCNCGQLSIELRTETLGTGVCHCLSCQRRTGSVFATIAAFGPDYTVTGKSTEYVRAGDAGAQYRFHFCPICGSTVFHQELGREAAYVAVAVGAFADPTFPPPMDSVYDCRRHRWVQLPAGIATYDKDPPA